MLRTVLWLVLAAIWVTPPGAPVAQGTDWSTLARTVSDLGTDTRGLPADLLQRRITSFATRADGGVYAVAYYLHRGDLLDAPLYLALRERGRPWQQRALTDPRQPEMAFGSAIDIHVSPSLLLIDTHINPSRGTLLVVRRSTLALETTLDGWLKMVLPSELVVYTESMRHFAPAHSEELHTYDSSTRLTARLYPTDHQSAVRRNFVNRLRPVFAAAASEDPTNAYGWDPELYDVSVDPKTLNYVPATDTLHFVVRFSSDRTPAASALRESHPVTCRPMKAQTRTCVEAR